VAEAWGATRSLCSRSCERTRARFGTDREHLPRTPAALAQHFATLDELPRGVITGSATAART
jgi:hypothetical protein